MCSFRVIFSFEEKLLVYFMGVVGAGDICGCQ